MRHLAVSLLLVGALALLGVWSAGADPITKQNGSTPVFQNFTSICSVPGYLNFGNCNGIATNFSWIKGKVNAIQAKEGRWNLGISFSGLQPGLTYRLWGNQDGATPSPGVISGFFIIGD